MSRDLVLAASERADFPGLAKNIVFRTALANQKDILSPHCRTSGIKIAKETYSKFVDALPSDLNKYFMGADEDDDDGSRVKCWYNTDSYIQVREERVRKNEMYLSIGWYTVKKDLHDSLDGFTRSCKVVPPPRERYYQSVHVLNKNMLGHYEIASIGTSSSPLEKDNYTDEVVEAFGKAKKVLSEAKPLGRIVLMDGPTGTGKTHLVKSLIAEVKSTFVLVPSTLVPKLSDPSLFMYLSRYTDTSRPLVIIVEDADQYITSREKENVGVLSSILNFGDGILGELLNMRLVLTTNSSHLTGTNKNNSIDEAILRPGRLGARLTVGKLPAEKATKLLRKLSGKDDVCCVEPQSLAEVYAEAWKMKGISEETHSKSVSDIL